MRFSLREFVIQLSVFITTIIVCFYAYGVMRFHEWRDEARAEVEENSRILPLNSGDLEYSIIGEGEPAIWFHGVGSGFDQRRNGIHRLKLIGVSRPGYLNSSEIVDQSLDSMVSIYAELLDDLGIEKVHVIGFSAGAMTALTFAEKHPNRVAKIVLISGISEGFSYPKPINKFQSGIFDFIYGDDYLGYQYVNDIVQNPVTFIKNQHKFFSESDISIILDDGKRMYDIIQYEIHVAASHSLRFPGHLIDHQQTKDFGKPTFTFENETLVIHGSDDTDVNIYHAKSANRRILNSELNIIEDAGHYLFLSQPSLLDSLILEFIEKSRS
jgi:pimeloyl-ACP methyl ester carboxylesterase